MATIKSYTDISQSKKLAEILPLESADLYYDIDFDKDYHIKMPTNGYFGNKRFFIQFPEKVPCWSLAALLGILPKICYFVKDHPTYLILGKPKDKWCVLYWDITGMQDGEQTLADNPVDACVAMIEKLNDLNLL